MDFTDSRRATSLVIRGGKNIFGNPAVVQEGKRLRAVRRSVCSRWLAKHNVVVVDKKLRGTLAGAADDR
jgi:hypothetical protein